VLWADDLDASRDGDSLDEVLFFEAPSDVDSHGGGEASQLVYSFLLQGF